MDSALKNGFGLFLDEESLRYAVDLICAKHGRVKSMQIFPASRNSQGGYRQCFCLLQLDSPEAQAALQSELKVSIFDHELAFVADVDERWSGQTILS